MISKRRLTLLIVLLATFSSSGYSQPELDTTFNLTGKQTTDVAPGFDGGAGVIVQPDNKILVFGTAGSGVAPAFGLVRYNEDGSLDGSFGIGGIVVTDFDTGFGNDIASGAALQSDGKIVLVGVVDFNANQGSFTVVRYNTDGTLDNSFGSGGKVVHNIETNAYDGASKVAIQPDGKIVVVGHFIISGSIQRELLVRYNTDGSLDGSFGTGGIVRTSMGSGEGGGNRGLAITLQSDGKIITTGTTRVVGSSTFWDACIVRYNSNGSPDNSFNSIGRRTIELSNGSDSFNAVAVQTDGKIVAAGFSGVQTPEFTLVRLNSNGSLDSTFDTDGIAVSGLNGELNGLTISPGGKLVIAGSNSADFAVARHNPDGSLDTTFSDDGKLLIDVGSSSFDIAGGVALDSRGRIVLGGRAGDFFGAVRLRALPSAANVSGRVTTSDGRPVFNATLYMDDGNGSVLVARTNPFGYYGYIGAPVGVYTITVVSKSHTFAPRTINVFDNLTDIDFVADP